MLPLHAWKPALKGSAVSYYVPPQRNTWAWGQADTFWNKNWMWKSLRELHTQKRVNWVLEIRWDMDNVVEPSLTVFHCFILLVPSSGKIKAKLIWQVWLDGNVCLMPHLCHILKGFWKILVCREVWHKWDRYFIWASVKHFTLLSEFSLKSYRNVKFFKYILKAGNLLLKFQWKL